MKIQFISDNQRSGKRLVATGYLQDEDIIFGVNNSYSAPFEGGQSKADVATDLVAQAISKGSISTKFSYMFTSFWNGAVPPKVTFKVAFVSVKEADDTLQQAMNLLDMFAMEKNAAYQLLPPGGLTASGLLNTIKSYLVSGSDNDITVNQGNRARTVSVYIGDENTASLKFLDLLPENVEFKGKLPLIVDGNFKIIYCTCTLQNPNLMLAGQPFMKRGGTV